MISSTQTEKRAILAVNDAFQEAEKFRRPYTKRWLANFKLAQGIPDKKMVTPDKKWRSTRFVPLTGMVIDLVVPRLFQGMPGAAAVGQTLSASLNEEKLNQKLNYDQSKMGLERVLNLSIKDGCTYGLGLWYTGWMDEGAENLPHSAKFIERMVSKIKKVVKDFSEEDLLDSRPDCRWVDPMSFYWDPSGTDIDDCAYVMERNLQSTYDLRKDPTVDKDIFKQLRMLTDMADPKELRERMAALGLSDNPASRIYEGIQDGKHEVIRYSGAFDIDNDGIEEECMITLIDRVLVARVEENPFWHGKKPYMRFPFDEIPGFFVGRSLVDRMAELQREYNDVTEQASDMRKLTLIPFMKYKLGSGLNPLTLKIAPGIPIGVKSMDDLEWDRPPDFTPALQSILRECRELIQLVTGANDVALGQQDIGIGDNTATGASIAQEQTEMRYKQPAILLDLQIQRFGNMMITNEQQFMPKTRTIPVVSDGITKWVDIEPKGIAGQFDYQMESGTITPANPTQQINNIVTALKLTQNNPAYDQGKLIDMALEKLKINPATIKQVQQGTPGGAQDALSQTAQQIAQMPPEAQSQALSELDPNDQQLMLKALAAMGVSIQQLSTPHGDPANPTVGPGGGAEPASLPAGPPSMAAPQGMPSAAPSLQ